MSKILKISIPLLTALLLAISLILVKMTRTSGNDILVSIKFIIYPITTIAISASFTLLIKITSKDKFTVFVFGVVFGLFSFFVFDRFVRYGFARVAGGEKWLVGISLYWLVGGGATIFVSIILNTIISYKITNMMADREEQKKEA
jgi:hypothetical protein